MPDINALTRTWNNGATTFTGMGLNVTDTASAADSLLFDLQVGSSSQFRVRKTGAVEVADGSAAAPSYSFGSDTVTGIYKGAGSGQINFAIGGALKTDLNASRFRLVGVPLEITNTSATASVYLHPDAANTLAQRNGTSAQALRVYNTYTDASNYERLNITGDSTNFYIQTASAGTGTEGFLALDSTQIRNEINGTLVCRVLSTGLDMRESIFWGTDNSHDIGASGANRPRTMYLRTRLELQDADIRFTDSSGNNAAFLVRDTNETLAMRRGTFAQTFRVYGTYTDASNYERLSISHFGSVADIDTQAAGTGTATILRLMQNGNVKMQFRTSDILFQDDLIAATDNTYDIGASGANRPRNIYAGTALIVPDGVTAPSATAGDAKIFVDSSDGDLKIIFGDGTTKTIVTDT